MSYDRFAQYFQNPSMFMPRGFSQGIAHLNASRFATAVKNLPLQNIIGALFHFLKVYYGPGAKQLLAEITARRGLSVEEALNEVNEVLEHKQSSPNRR